MAEHALKTSDSFLQDRPQFIPCLVSAVMLGLALFHWPYGYYQILRWIVCGTSAFAAFTAYNANKQVSLWLLIGIAILFNPLVPIHLDRQVWQVIDIATAAVFVGVGIIHTRATLPTTELSTTAESIPIMKDNDTKEICGTLFVGAITLTWLITAAYFIVHGFADLINDLT